MLGELPATEPHPLCFVVLDQSLWGKPDALCEDTPVDRSQVEEQSLLPWAISTSLLRLPCTISGSFSKRSGFLTVLEAPSPRSRAGFW
jgi:hypothetical protein